jgi:prepilin-type processing-associated H-X9-DG protein
MDKFLTGGRTPDGSKDNDYSNSAQTFIPRILTCPSDNITTLPNVTYKGVRNRSYSSFGGPINRGPFMLGGGANQLDFYGKAAHRKQFSSVANDTILLMEWSDGMMINADLPNSPYGTTAGATRDGACQQVLVPGVTTMPSGGPVGNISLPLHAGGRFNYLMADGHVASMTPYESADTTKGGTNWINKMRGDAPRWTYVKD